MMVAIDMSQEAQGGSDPSWTRVTRGQALFASWATDVLVFIVVLELFVQYRPAVITESFTISIFTAVVLKLLIDAISRLEHRVGEWFEQREALVWRVLRVVTLLAILFVSKFAVIEVINLFFGDRVTLGGFIDVALLVLTMIAAHQGVDLSTAAWGGRAIPQPVLPDLLWRRRGAPSSSPPGPQISAVSSTRSARRSSSAKSPVIVRSMFRSARLVPRTGRRWCS